MTTSTTNAAIFTPKSLTMNGKTFDAGYSVTPSGTVYVFVTVQDGDKPANLRIKIDQSDANYPAALAAAQAEPATEAEQPTQAEPAAQAEPAEAESAAEAEPATEAEQPAEAEPNPKKARGPVPEKLFVGLEIKGKGWKIVFDGGYDRTRVIFKRKPGKAAEEAVKKAGFYWSPVLESWNKKLTHKAFRAAQALALELRAICG